MPAGSMLFPSLRAVRLARHLLTPQRHKGIDTRNVAFLKLVLRSKKNCVLFATFPKSGWNWSADVLDHALLTHFRGSYEIDYVGDGTLKQREKKDSVFAPADARAASQQLLRDRIPGLDIDLCFHTHGQWRESPLFGLDAAKTVIVARNIPTALFSYYRSRRIDTPFEVFLEQGALDRVLTFYNSWAAFLRRPGARGRVFHYEELRRNPVAQFSAMANYVFGVDLPQTCIENAVAHFSFEKRKEREWAFAQDERKHFHFRGAVDYSDMMSEETRARIDEVTSERLDPLFTSIAKPPRTVTG